MNQPESSLHLSNVGDTKVIIQRQQAIIDAWLKADNHCIKLYLIQQIITLLQSMYVYVHGVVTQ
jgi:hypothetical protein